MPFATLKTQHTGRVLFFLSSQLRAPPPQSVSNFIAVQNNHTPDLERWQKKGRRDKGVCVCRREFCEGASLTDDGGAVVAHNAHCEGKRWWVELLSRWYTHNIKTRVIIIVIIYFFLKRAEGRVGVAVCLQRPHSLFSRGNAKAPLRTLGEH